jgi:hypothetical protein
MPGRYGVMRMRRRAMQAKFSTMFVAGLFTAACATAILLPAGCQSSNQVAATNAPSGPTEVCPLCGQETRTQPLTRLKYTTCVCPTCKQVSAIDPETLQKIEDVFGYTPEFMVTVCEGCAVIVRECAVCRQSHA